MRPKEIFINPDAVDADGLAQAQAVGAAGNLTLNGALIVGGSFTGDYARQIGILSAADDSGITFLVTGTDADGKAQTETITGSSGAPGTAESTSYFKTITSIYASGAAAGNVSVGTVDEFVTNTIPIESSNSDPCEISLERFSGTINVSVYETFSRIQNSPIVFQGSSALINETSETHGTISNHATGIRLVCNSYSSGAELYMIINQNRAF